MRVNVASCPRTQAAGNIRMPAPPELTKKPGYSKYRSGEHAACSRSLADFRCGSKLVINNLPECDNRAFLSVKKILKKTN